MIDGEDFVFKSLSARERIVTVVQVLLLQHRESPTIQVEFDPSTLSETLSDVALSSRPGNSRGRAQSCPTEINPGFILNATRSDRNEVERVCRGELTRKTCNEEVLFATGTSIEKLMQSWTKEKQEQESKYKERAIDNVILNWSLSDFFDHFLSDDAPHSILRYQELEIGDTQVKATKWTPSDGDCITRTISFCHPIANSFGIGPSSTLATKKQTLHRYGDFGLCLATTTNISGVPAADTFHVADHWLVEQISSHEIRFSVLHETVFTKRTIFKRVIEASTKIEIKSWYTGYLAMLVGHVQGEDKASPIIPVRNLDASSTSRKWLSIWQVPAIAVALLALLCQNYMLNSQVRQLHMELKSIQQQQTIALQLMQEVLARSNTDHGTVRL
jgi:VAD1 Analog of StAR-related lipid transfer domain